MVHHFRFPTLLALALALIAMGILSSGGAGAAGPPDGNGLDHVIAVQDAHTDRLLAKPGVVGTAVGLNADGQPVIVIYTESAGVAGLPRELDGVPVLAEVTGRIFALAPPPTVASFTYTCSGLTCDFDGSASTGRGRLSYDWNFGDGTPGSGVTVSHTYAAAGTYQVTLTATASKSGPDSETQDVTVSDGGGGTNSPPTASFTHSCAGTTCDFTDTSSDSDGGVVAWGWDFGDGNTSTTQHPTHTYGSDGTYIISLTVTDDGGAAGSDSQSVAVSSTVDPTSRFDRPVPIGVSTGHPNITAGTIGSRVTDGTSVFALSNNHVYANQNNAAIGDPALQPGPVDGGTSPADDIGTLSDYEPILFDGSDNYMDAAIALSSAANLGNATPSDGYGTPGSALVSATLNLPVQKYGRTTSLTTGTVSEINVIVNVCYEGFLICTKSAKFVDQIAITPGSFSAGGDSGSLIVTNDGNNNPIGLLFAGSSTHTFANRIDLVLNRFGVAIDGAGNSGPSVTITSPADGSVVEGSAVAVAADATDDVGVTQVEFFVDGASIGVDIDGTNGWSATWDTTLSTEDADHTVVATATNTADHTASDIVTVTVDNTDNPPSVQITSPANGATVSGTVITTADATDDRGVGQVEFFVGGASIGTDGDGSNGWSVAWDTSTATDGGYTVTATATDSASQTASDSVSVTVNNSAATTVSVGSVTYSMNGPHLLITVALIDNLSNPVSGASVDMFLVNTDTGQLWIGSDGTTGDDGTETWRLRNAPSGCYTTSVLSVIADGLAWDFVTPPNEFCS